MMISRRLKVEGHGGLIRGIEETPSVPTSPVHLIVPLHLTKTTGNPKSRTDYYKEKRKTLDSFIRGRGYKGRVASRRLPWRNT